MNRIKKGDQVVVITGKYKGQKGEVLRVDAEKLVGSLTPLTPFVSKSPFAGELQLAIKDAYKRLLAASCEVDVRVEMKLRADRDAVSVFAQNLRELLLAAPYGTKTVLGVDPGSHRLGYGVVYRKGSRYHHVAHGVVRAPSDAQLPERLRVIAEGLERAQNRFNS
mgnify:CR=1 FL=1